MRYQRTRTKNLNNTKGMSKLLVMEIVLVIVLSAAIIIPVVMDTYENRMEELDEECISAAKRAAELEYSNRSKALVAVYDSEKKKLLDHKEAEFINDYANARIHKHELILVSITEDGEITADWQQRTDIEALDIK